MNLLLISTEPGRVGIFATAEPKKLRDEISREVLIDQHYTIACEHAHDVERECRRALANRQIGDGTWYGTSFGEAIGVVSAVIDKLGAGTPVVCGFIGRVALNKPHLKLVLQ